MGIFSRFTDIINSNITALLDKAEDPAKMLKLMIQEMEDTLIEIRTTSAKSLAEQKQIQRKIEEGEKQLADWEEKAILALNHQKEDLARLALMEKQKVVEWIDVLKRDLADISEAIEKMKNEITALEQKLVETRNREQTLALRHEAAGNSLEARKNLNSGKTEAAMARFEQLERRIDGMNAEYEALNFGKTKDINQQFAELKAGAEIENELAKLKEKLQKSE
ncbi:phage shock protein PspA [Thorsellia kenyensis]|uniref:Phage shock protein PspA n=1 Tax=Thorsellia kenyensis TaxID=1549888 RepID=A0ABV6C773_9GAMM